MDITILFLLATAFCLLSITYLVSGKEGLSTYFRRLRLRRISAGLTPSAASRQRPPEKSAGENIAPADFRDVFPPSRRSFLAFSNACAPESVSQNIRAAAPDAPVTASNGLKPELCIPFARPINDAEPSMCTPTGFSVEEIRALGDFPDYASLSGVPLPKAYVGFDIAKALPRPYRPLRWPYHQTMALSKMEPDWWLELDHTYVERIRERQELFKRNGKSILDYLPGSELACKELMEMCVQFLCARYPYYFSLDKPKIMLRNDILHTETDLKTTHPLHVLLDNVPEDFAVMIRNPETGLYHFRAGLLCSALGWTVATKLGLRLHEIHAPIPDYKEKMQFSMDRYFSKKPTDSPIQRGSWGLEVDTPLYMPPGDPHEKHRESQNSDLTLSRCHLRVDWQTLRRLPLSGAIIFNFKALFTPVQDFRQEPYIPSLLLMILNHGKENIMQYKSTWHVEHVVKPALQQYEREQINKGMTLMDWDARTLDESPWYPGWEGMWRAKQGF